MFNKKFVILYLLKKDLEKQKKNIKKNVLNIKKSMIVVVMIKKMKVINNNKIDFFHILIF